MYEGGRFKHVLSFAITQRVTSLLPPVELYFDHGELCGLFGFVVNCADFLIELHASATVWRVHVHEPVGKSGVDRHDQGGKKGATPGQC